MTAYRVTPTANAQIDEINDYTAQRWGERQAALYTSELFAEFERIAARRAPWRRLPASTGLDGYRLNWRSHVIYWRVEENGEITVVAVLHAHMDQTIRARRAFGGDDHAHPSST